MQCKQLPVFANKVHLQSTFYVRYCYFMNKLNSKANNIWIVHIKCKSTNSAIFATTNNFDILRFMPA